MQIATIKKPTQAQNIGLSTAEAEKKLNTDGKNQLAEQKRDSMLKVFLGQFRDIMIIILLVCTVVSVATGEIFDAITIIVIVLLNATLGFVQEYRTEKTLEALKKISAPKAKVYRDGVLSEIPASNLVKNDVIQIEAGDNVPADCKVLKSTSLACDESALTGESLPVTKVSGNPTDNALNQKNVVYMGTTITKGHGMAEVIATGKATQMGMVSHLLADIEKEKTPLQKRLGDLGKVLAISCTVICIIVAGIGVLQGHDLFEMFFVGISLAVAAIPEGLPAAVTIALALAVRRIYKQKALVNKLHSVEALGCTNVICSDKTGTLTKNKMTVTQVFANGEMMSLESAALKPTLQKLLLCGAVCNNATMSENGYSGDPTETALLASAKTKGITPNLRRVDEIPFDSMTRYMVVVTEANGCEREHWLKGASDVVLAMCDRVMMNGESVMLNASQKNNIQQAVSDMTGKALRTLAFAYRRGNSGKYTFIGLQGMSDPLRPEVIPAVKKCKKAGIKTVMITGDHKNTAAEIAKQAGILQGNLLVVTGEELNRMSDTELANKLDKIAVFARVSPSDKLRIVKAFKAKGNVVAMTGDGVNDAPAVKEATIGVSMGIQGTDVTKEAAQIVLLDDNFATLVNAVEQGRTIYTNIRKFIRYMLSCNIGEVLCMLGAMLMNLPVVLIPIQILLVNLVTDGLPAVALSLEPTENDAMSQAPRPVNEGVFANGMLGKIIGRGISIGVFTVLSFLMVYDLSDNLIAGRTAALLTLGISQLAFAFECKDEKKGLFNVNYANNPKLIFAVLISFVVLMLAVYTDIFRMIFQTALLSPQEMLIALGFALGYPLLKSIFKLIKD